MVLSVMNKVRLWDKVSRRRIEISLAGVARRKFTLEGHLSQELHSKKEQP